MSESNLHPWDRREDETAKAYQAFLTYLEMGVQARSIREVARVLGKSDTLIGRWSSGHDWVSRSKEWDEHQQQLVNTERTERRKAILDRESADAEKLLKQWDELFSLGKAFKVSKTETLPDGNMIKTVEVGVSEWRALTALRKQISSLIRRAAEMPETITNTQLTGEDSGPIKFRFVWEDVSDEGGHGND